MHSENLMNNIRKGFTHQVSRNHNTQQKSLILLKNKRNITQIDNSNGVIKGSYFLRSDGLSSIKKGLSLVEQKTVNGKYACKTVLENVIVEIKEPDTKLDQTLDLQTKLKQLNARYRYNRCYINRQNCIPDPKQIVLPTRQKIKGWMDLLSIDESILKDDNGGSSFIKGHTLMHKLTNSSGQFTKE